jgi:hypothetical protein
MATARGDFKISRAALGAPAEPSAESGDSSVAALGPATPLLFALARNPRTLFVCWAVDWAKAFRGATRVPAAVHVRVQAADGVDLTRIIEPMRGQSSIGELEPGTTYAVELGFFGGEGEWRTVAGGAQATLPLEAAVGNDGQVQVATLPLHLEFQKLMDLFGAEKSGRITGLLAGLEERALSDETSAQKLDALGLGQGEAREATAVREHLEKLRPPLPARRRTESSWSGGGS